jgi:putative endonuclease
VSRDALRGVWRALAGWLGRKPRPPEGETIGQRRRRAGQWGEDVAAEHLKREGWKILARNVRFGPRMELDIVARQPRPPVLVFVEVKTRKSEALGRPSSSVDAAKRRAQDRAARKYLKHLGTRRPANWRFDIVEVVGDPDSATPPTVHRIEGAWSISGPEWG